MSSTTPEQYSLDDYLRDIVKDDEERYVDIDRKVWR